VYNGKGEQGEIDWSEFIICSMVLEWPGTFEKPILIEKASWRDFQALRRLEKICFPKDAWPIIDLIGVLTLPNVVRLKAVLGEEIIGFIASDLRPSEQAAWIATICVLPEHRRKGIGAALLEECQKEITYPVVRLCVRLTNHSAIRMYEQFGYQRINIWRRYYSDGEDAAVMEKYLQAS
jgi:ribosomal protein S18 acetylase RimI-like enzyme